MDKQDSRSTFEAVFFLVIMQRKPLTLNIYAHTFWVVWFNGERNTYFKCTAVFSIMWIYKWLCLWSPHPTSPNDLLLQLNVDFREFQFSLRKLRKILLVAQGPCCRCTSIPNLLFRIWCHWDFLMELPNTFVSSFCRYLTNAVIQDQNPNNSTTSLCASFLVVLMSPSWLEHGMA